MIAVQNGGGMFLTLSKAQAALMNGSINQRHAQQHIIEVETAATITHTTTTCGFSSWNAHLYIFFQSGAGMAVVLGAAAASVAGMARAIIDPQ